MKVGTEVLIQPEAFRDDIQYPVVAETVEPFWGELEEDKVSIKIKPSYRWTHANTFIVDKKYCVVR